MATSVFESYDEEYVSIVKDVRKDLSHALTYEADADAKRTQLRNVDLQLGQAEDLLKQMGIEARSASSSGGKKQMQDKLVTYKRAVGGLRDEYKRGVGEMERDGLFGAPSGDASREQRGRLLQTNEKLNQQGERIENSKRMVLEIEDTAMEISSELGRNREKITGIHGKVREVSSITSQARRLVHSMSRREVQQKFILWMVALLLVSALVIVIYFTAS